jgi:hypothetical protein
MRCKNHITDMNYYNLKRKKKLPNRKLDLFLSQLQQLCKKHKMMILKTNKDAFIIEPYDDKIFKKTLTKVQDDTTLEIEEDPENKQNE